MQLSRVSKCVPWAHQFHEVDSEAAIPGTNSVFSFILECFRSMDAPSSSEILLTLNGDYRSEDPSNYGSWRMTAMGTSRQPSITMRMSSSKAENMLFP